MHQERQKTSLSELESNRGPLASLATALTTRHMPPWAHGFIGHMDSGSSRLIRFDPLGKSTSSTHYPAGPTDVFGRKEGDHSRLSSLLVEYYLKKMASKHFHLDRYLNAVWTLTRRLFGWGYTFRFECSENSFINSCHCSSKSKRSAIKLKKATYVTKWWFIDLFQRLEAVAIFFGIGLNVFRTFGEVWAKYWPRLGGTCETSHA